MSHSIFPPNSSAKPLPDFASLVIQGPYPPSAPLHLCLSHLTTGPQTNKALLISPSNKHLSSTLDEYNDAWLGEHAGHGSVAEHLHQIDIFYPPTHKHLRLLLARLRTFSTPGVDGDTETDMKVCVARVPTLVVLHELSRYFLLPKEGEEDVELLTLSTYMQLVIDTIATLTFLHKSSKSSTRPRLVIFDTHLRTLVLPIHRPIRSSLLTKLPAQHKARATDVLKRLVEWIGTVERVEEIPSSQADEAELSMHELEPEKEHFRMVLVQTSAPNATVETFHWYTFREPDERPFSTRRRTHVRMV